MAGFELEDASLCGHKHEDFMSVSNLPASIIPGLTLMAHQATSAAAYNEDRMITGGITEEDFIAGEVRDINPAYTAEEAIDPYLRFMKACQPSSNRHCSQKLMNTAETTSLTPTYGIDSVWDPTDPFGWKQAFQQSNKTSPAARVSKKARDGSGSSTTLEIKNDTATRSSQGDRQLLDLLLRSTGQSCTAPVFISDNNNQRQESPLFEPDEPDRPLSPSPLKRRPRAHTGRCSQPQRQARRQSRYSLTSRDSSSTVQDPSPTSPAFKAQHTSHSEHSRWIAKPVSQRHTHSTEPSPSALPRLRHLQREAPATLEDDESPPLALQQLELLQTRFRKRLAKTTKLCSQSGLTIKPQNAEWNKLRRAVHRARPKIESFLSPIPDSDKIDGFDINRLSAYHDKVDAWDKEMDQRVLLQKRFMYEAQIMDLDRQMDVVRKKGVVRQQSNIPGKGYRMETGNAWGGSEDEEYDGQIEDSVHR